MGGGALGALIGILGGPLGVLLGFLTGALFGSLVDTGNEIDDDSVLSTISAALDEAERKGLVLRQHGRVTPTERGFDFLSDLQALFLGDA